LEQEITQEQRAFLDEHGFILFGNVVREREIQDTLSELERIEAQWIEERRRKVNGIPIYYGRFSTGQRYVQRFAFASLFSARISTLVNDARFLPVRTLIGEGARVGEREKDGVVVNRYLNAEGSTRNNLGWHTDGLRDIFYLRRPKPQLNVGLHFDRCHASQGGLRVLPGTHRQGIWSMLTKKLYFVSHKPDPDEVAIETEPGDLTVHDGRTWHRVQRSSSIGDTSLRRTMYVPYLTDPYQPKEASSPTPLYHFLGAIGRGP
jgi:ectoine hydroxylase-related dioxygenase (phytanoyl-CoA dioxygenase family)